MSRGRVLVIEGDEREGQALARALAEHHFTVDVCTHAREGFQRACDIAPDCIVCSTELPDIDGAWLARRIRTESSTVARTAILFIGDGADRATRAQALSVGGDVFLARPVDHAGLVTQVAALVAMARRLRPPEGEPPPSSLSPGAAIRGDLSLFPLASILMMFELERRSGAIEVVSSSGKRASMIFTHGLFADTELGGQPKPALDVLREVLSWRAGRFAFTPRDGVQLPAPRASVGALVLEAMRLEDELKHGSEPPLSVVPTAHARETSAPPARPAPKSSPGVATAAAAAPQAKPNVPRPVSTTMLKKHIAPIPTPLPSPQVRPPPPLPSRAPLTKLEPTPIGDPPPRKS